MATVTNPHSKTGTFFTTDLTGTRLWLDLLGKRGIRITHDIKESGFIPIILKFYLNRTKRTIDTHKATGFDYKTDKIIPPQGITVWNGESWIPVHDWRLINLNKFINPTNDPEKKYIFKPPYNDKKGYPLPQY